MGSESDGEKPTSREVQAALEQDWIASVENGLVALKARLDEDEPRIDIELVSTIAEEINGLAASFGYPLLGAVAGRLSTRYRDREGVLDAHEIPIVRAFHAALDVIVSRRHKGDGGESGEQLLKGLDALLGE